MAGQLTMVAVDDTYERRIVTRCCYLSKDIYEYFICQNYYLGVEDREVVDDTYLMNLALSQIYDELNNMGLYSNNSFEDILSSNIDIEYILTLRQFFDPQVFFNFLKDMQVEDYQALILKIEQTTIPGELLESIIEYFSLSEKFTGVWNDLSAELFNYFSTAEFNTYLGNIIDRVELSKDPNNVAIAPEDMSAYVAFVEKMQRRIEIGYQLAQKLRNEGYPLPLNLHQTLDVYDYEKLRPDVIAHFIHMTEEDEHRIPEPYYLAEHHRIAPHHMPYFLLHNRMPDRTECFMVILSFYLDKMNKKEILKELEILKPIDDLESDPKKRMLPILLNYLDAKAWNFEGGED